MKINPCFNKKYIFALTLVVCLLASMFSASSVKAEDGPILSKELRHIFYPSFVMNNESVTAGASNPSQPYMAGYMTTDYLSGSPIEDRVAAVCVTVSFKGTDNSIIQDGNALAAGIAAQGQSSSGEPWPFGETYIDYGYTMLLVVDNQYDWPFIQGIVWEVVEWGPNNLWPVEDPVVNIVDYFTWEFPLVLKMDSEVTLIMKWNLNPNVTSYSVIIDDYPEYPIQTLIPNDIQNDYFMLGTEEREHQFWEPFIDLPGTVKFFQFPGAWSNINIGQIGWHSYLSHPGFKKTEESSWTDVPFAYSVNGTASWLDNTVNWGGACYDSVNADYTYQHVHFYPTSDGTTLEPDTLLWAPPTCAMKTKTDGYFYVPNVATDLLKIEMLFDNANLTGDQTGGTSPYPAIANYPDGKVSGMDIAFVNSKYGSWEGETSPVVWDYMADVNPDRRITGVDVALVCKNFGLNGTYITDLAGVAITFNTGQTVSPESDGFVTIPPGATNFNVTRYGTLIGAMVIFW